MCLVKERIELMRIPFVIAVLLLFAGAGIMTIEGGSSRDRRTDVQPSSRGDGIPVNEWPQWRGGPEHTGNATCPGPSTGGKLWQSRERSNYYSSPAVKYGRVYIGREEILYCYDAATGATLWSHDLVYATHSSPLIFGGRVYIGAGSELFCLDANGTGNITTRHWTAEIGGTVDSSPTTDGVDDIFIATDNGALKAIYTNGTEHWSSSLYGGGTACSPSYWNGRVYIGGGGWAGGDCHVYSFDADTGERIWSYKLDSPVCSSPALAYGNVYIAGSGDVGGMGEFGNVYCLDAMGSGGTTTVVWKRDIGGAYSSPAVGYGRIYIGSNTGELRCLDAFGNATGGTHQYWARKFKDWTHCSPVISSEYVFTGTGDGRFYCLNRTDMSTVWSWALDTSGGTWGIATSPALAGNLIYMTNDGDRLYCIGSKADTQPPRVLDTVPAPNATEVPADIEIEISFDKSVDASTITNETLTLKDPQAADVPCEVYANTAADTAYLRPHSPLGKDEPYTVTVSTGITDRLGMHLDGDGDGSDEGAGVDEYVFAFRTAPNYPPIIAAIPVQHPVQGQLHVLNLSSYIKDPDTPKEMLLLDVNSTYIEIFGLELHMTYPKGVSGEIVNLSVSDGDFPTPTYREFQVEAVPDYAPPVNNNFTFIARENDTNNLTFTANPATYEGDSTALTYAWDFGDGSSATGMTVDHAYVRTDKARKYVVSLVVSDGSKDSSVCSQTATIPAYSPVITDDDDTIPDDDDTTPGDDDISGDDDQVPDDDDIVPDDDDDATPDDDDDDEEDGDTGPGGDAGSGGSRLLLGGIIAAVLLLVVIGIIVYTVMNMREMDREASGKAGARPEKKPSGEAGEPEDKKLKKGTKKHSKKARKAPGSKAEGGKGKGKPGKKE